MFKYRLKREWQTVAKIIVGAILIGIYLGWDNLGFWQGLVAYLINLKLKAAGVILFLESVEYDKN